MEFWLGLCKELDQIYENYYGNKIRIKRDLCVLAAFFGAVDELSGKILSEQESERVKLQRTNCTVDAS
jgi:hypothetical protein